MSATSSPASDPPFRPEPGARLGAYRLIAPLGRGSMGEVWEGTGPAGPVALKIPLRPAFLRHLRREGLLLAEVEHPNVARFVEAELEGPTPFLATELIRGQPLRELCRGTMSSGDVTKVADQILAGLGAIHAAGVLHLDLKPENVIVQTDGQVKIVDLGLGRATTRFMEEVYLSVSLVSREIQAAGTLAYMSPEQRKGKELDARCDLFAFGVLLHELLCGELPVPGKRLTDLRPDLAPRWDVVVSKLTHPRREARPADAEQVRRLVAYTLVEKARVPVAEGGQQPRDLRGFDEEVFGLASPFAAGMVVGEGYELETPLGRGGYGEVWRARRGEARVAVKLILAESARPGLRHEAAVAAKLDHRGIPKLLGDHADEDPAHLVFELVEGHSLRLLIHEEEQLPVVIALRIALGMVELAEACARAEVAHCDLKPEHFLVAWVGDLPRVSLIDFGLAAHLPEAALAGSLATQDVIRGTVDYMAPEQKQGLIEPAVDVYALGVCLFELLTFSLPRGPQRLKSLRREVPAKLDRLVVRMLSASPRKRPSLSDVRLELRWILDTLLGGSAQAGEPGEYQLLASYRRRVRWTSAVVLVAFLGGTSALYIAHRPGSIPEVLAELEETPAMTTRGMRLLDHLESIGVRRPGAYPRRNNFFTRDRAELYQLWRRATLRWWERHPPAKDE